MTEILLKVLITKNILVYWYLIEVVHVKYLLGFSKNQIVPIFVKLGHNFSRRVFVVHAPQMFGFEGSSVAKPGDGREPVESKS